MAWWIWLIIYVVWVMIGDVVMGLIDEDGQLTAWMKRGYEMNFVSSFVAMFVFFGLGWPVIAGLYLWDRRVKHGTRKKKSE